MGGESSDLVYLDPPFNSAQDYNVLFAEHGTRAAAQIKAFEDTWRWDESAARAYAEVVESGGKVSLARQAFRRFIGESDMLAYPLDDGSASNGVAPRPQAHGPECLTCAAPREIADVERAMAGRRANR
jgi:hypothetical protein